MKLIRAAIILALGLALLPVPALLVWDHYWYTVGPISPIMIGYLALVAVGAVTCVFEGASTVLISLRSRGEHKTTP